MKQSIPKKSKNSKKNRKFQKIQKKNNTFLDLNMTLDPQVLEKVKSIGDDKYLDDKRDRDRVADGNQQCPIS